MCSAFLEAGASRSRQRPAMHANRPLPAGEPRRAPKGEVISGHRTDSGCCYFAIAWWKSFLLPPLLLKRRGVVMTSHTHTQSLTLSFCSFEGCASSSRPLVLVCSIFCYCSEFIRASGYEVLFKEGKCLLNLSFV